MNKLKKIFVVLGSMLSMGGRALPSTNVSLASVLGLKKRRSIDYSKYVGCPDGKFDSMSRQRLRAKAKLAITQEVKTNFSLPRRIARAIVRTRVNREWRAA